ncbi:MAG TPA: FecR domain-containing protein [Gemmatimonas sp.]|nr:FecR domain-containing protein [Gemmatimonas sp.]
MPDSSRNDDAPQDDAGAGADWEALARYASGECAPAEAAVVRAWLETHPAAASLVETVLPRIIPAIPDPLVNAVDSVKSVDVERALATVRARIAAESTGAIAGAPAPALTVSAGGAADGTVRNRASRNSTGAAAKAARPWYSGARGLAAAAALVMAIGFGARTAMQPESVAASAAGSRVYETAVGVRDSVLLADGSRVILAPGSRLTVPASFDSARTVDLEGAAYFEVRHDEVRPFTVRSRGAEVRDIGTAFSVTTDATGSVSVAVTEGVVAMRSMASPATRGVELKAGDRGVLRGRPSPNDPASSGTPSSGTPSQVPAASGDDSQATGDVVDVTRGTVTADDMAWTQGDLSYRDAPVAIVLADLRRWYGINLVVTDSLLLRQTLKISFRGDSPAGALRKVALALGVETIERGDTVRLQRPATVPADRR